MKNDVYFLKLAVKEGNKKAKPYNFGAVIVKDSKTLAIEHGHVQETNNPALHAEISAIIAACKKLGSHNIPGCTLYASHEPCMMCMACAAWAEVDRIVFSTPASEQSRDMYEFHDVNIFELAQKLNRPLHIERIKL